MDSSTNGMLDIPVPPSTNPHLLSPPAPLDPMSNGHYPPYPTHDAMDSASHGGMSFDDGSMLPPIPTLPSVDSFKVDSSYKLDAPSYKPEPTFKLPPPIEPPDSPGHIGLAMPSLSIPDNGAVPAIPVASIPSAHNGSVPHLTLNMPPTPRCVTIRSPRNSVTLESESVMLELPTNFNHFQHLVKAAMLARAAPPSPEAMYKNREAGKFGMLPSQASAVRLFVNRRNSGAYVEVNSGTYHMLQDGDVIDVVPVTEAHTATPPQIHPVAQQQQHAQQQHPPSHAHQQHPSQRRSPLAVLQQQQKILQEQAQRAYQSYQQQAAHQAQQQYHAMSQPLPSIPGSFSYSYDTTPTTSEPTSPITSSNPSSVPSSMPSSATNSPLSHHAQPNYYPAHMQLPPSSMSGPGSPSAMHTSPSLSASSHSSPSMYPHMPLNRKRKLDDAVPVIPGVPMYDGEHHRMMHPNVAHAMPAHALMGKRKKKVQVAEMLDTSNMTIRIFIIKYRDNEIRLIQCISNVDGSSTVYVHGVDVGMLLERKSNISRMYGEFASGTEKAIVHVIGKRNYIYGQKVNVLTEKGIARLMKLRKCIEMREYRDWMANQLLPYVRQERPLEDLEVFDPAAQQKLDGM